MTSRRIFALALAVLTGLLGGCSRYPKGAATYDGGEIPAGVYIYYQITALQEAAAAGEEAGDVGEKAMDYARQFAAVEEECARRDIALDEATVGYIEAEIAREWADKGTVLEKNGIAQSSAVMLSKNASKRTLLFETLYGELGEEPVPDAELQETYRQNYRRVLMLVMPKYDENMVVYTEDALAAYEAQVAEYRTLADAGTPLFDLILRYEEQQNAAAQEQEATENPQQEESQREVVVWKDSTNYPPDFLGQLFASDQSGVLLYDGQLYTVLYEVRDLMGDGGHFLSVRSGLRQLARGEVFGQRLLDIAAELHFTPDPQAVKVYTADKLKFE